LTVAL